MGIEPYYIFVFCIESIVPSSQLRFVLCFRRIQRMQAVPPRSQVIFQVPRGTMAAILSALTATVPDVSAFYNTDGTINSSSAFARRFSFFLGLLICCKRAQQIGGVIVQVEGDGNCLARAISVVLYGHENQYTDVRLLYCGGVLCNPELQAFVPDFERRRYIADHFPGGRAWGGNVELDAIGRIFGLTVFLITDIQHSPVIEVCRHGQVAICLAYRGSNHYDLLGFPAESGTVVQISSVMAFAEFEPQPHEVAGTPKEKRGRDDHVEMDPANETKN